jgi:hypothetical protein
LREPPPSTLMAEELVAKADDGTRR